MNKTERGVALAGKTVPALAVLSVVLLMLPASGAPNGPSKAPLIAGTFHADFPQPDFSSIRQSTSVDPDEQRRSGDLARSQVAEEAQPVQVGPIDL